MCVQVALHGLPSNLSISPTNNFSSHVVIASRLPSRMAPAILPAEVVVPGEDQCSLQQAPVRADCEEADVQILANTTTLVGVVEAPEKQIKQ